MDDLDLFTGGLLETTPEGPGELFQKIILEQFLRIRHGDRFWFENQEHRFVSIEKHVTVYTRLVFYNIHMVLNIYFSSESAAIFEPFQQFSDNSFQCIGERFSSQPISKLFRITAINLNPCLHFVTFFFIS